ncbi:MAG: hypothetical protein IJA29_03445 [Lachnospiraceae bacterium]|nr:hypothetical protein [Lachnospiraceae bacterium]
MDGIFFIIALVYGVIMGIGVALAITGIILKKSNEHGNSKGDLYDFNGTTMHFLNRQQL